VTAWLAWRVVAGGGPFRQLVAPLPYAVQLALVAAARCLAFWRW